MDVYMFHVQLAFQIAYCIHLGRSLTIEMYDLITNRHATRKSSGSSIMKFGVNIHDKYLWALNIRVWPNMLISQVFRRNLIWNYTLCMLSLFCFQTRFQQNISCHHSIMTVISIHLMLCSFTDTVHMYDVSCWSGIHMHNQLWRCYDSEVVTWKAAKRIHRKIGKIYLEIKSGPLPCCTICSVWLKTWGLILVLCCAFSIWPRFELSQ